MEERGEGERWRRKEDPSIEEGSEAPVASADEARPPPGLEGHHAVVEHVEEREVSELLLEDKEDGVGEVEELRDVEDPGEVEGPEGLGPVGVVDGLARPAVGAADVEPPTLGGAAGGGAGHQGDRMKWLNDTW